MHTCTFTDRSLSNCVIVPKTTCIKRDKSLVTPTYTSKLNTLTLLASTPQFLLAADEAQFKLDETFCQGKLFYCFLQTGKLGFLMSNAWCVHSACCPSTPTCFRYVALSFLQFLVRNCQLTSADWRTSHQTIFIYLWRASGSNTKWKRNAPLRMKRRKNCDSKFA